MLLLFHLLLCVLDIRDSLLLGRICSLSAAGLYSSGISDLNTSTCMITCLAARTLIKSSLQYLICHIVKAFGSHHRGGDIAGVSPAEEPRCEKNADLLLPLFIQKTHNKESPVYTSSNYWEIEALRHLTNVRTIFTLLARRPSFKDSGSSAATAPTELESLPVACRCFFNGQCFLKLPFAREGHQKREVRLNCKMRWYSL